MSSLSSNNATGSSGGPMSPASASVRSAMVRKNRNFRDLNLKVDAPPPPQHAPELIPSSLVAPAPPAGAPTKAKKKPPKMNLAASRKPGTGPAPLAAAGTSSVDADGMLTVVPGISGSAPPSGSLTSKNSSYQGMLTEKIADMDLAARDNQEPRIEVKAEDLRELSELGQGNGGSVKKVEHVPTGKIMAKKIVLIDAKPSVRKQILRELQILYSCHSPHIVSFYSAFVQDPNICMCIEFMDKGSLDNIYKKTGAIDIDVVGKIALAVLEGLTYLYEVHHIIHRDIKPSNILVNSKGHIKICDFGVSGELINSIADTFVGTSTYMSPERIQGAQYTVKSDVWSLGVSLIELALGRFPFADASSDDSDLSDLEGTLSPHRPSPGMPLSLGAAGAATSSAEQRKKDKAKKEKRKSKGVSLQGGGMTMSILELLQHIVNEPAPRLTPEGRFAKEAEEFVDKCLIKDPEERLAPKDLLKLPWMKAARVKDVDLEGWASTV
ncbi:Pkinase-domain-containing protein [Auriculariales sp. MPI-PUGE-AT-0066]|nr:Pkinase-domain-containing protein [Auriculariales sp. MPI-PUGE-AT-0066]